MNTLPNRLTYTTRPGGYEGRKEMTMNTPDTMTIIESAAFDLADASEALDYFTEDLGGLDSMTAAVEFPRYAARLRALAALIRRATDELNDAIKRGEEKPDPAA